MKKTKIISLVLISASFTGCIEYETIRVPYANNNMQGNDTVQMWANQPYFNYYDYYNPFFCNWNFFPGNYWWGGHRAYVCYDRHGKPIHYGPRHPIGTNVARMFNNHVNSAHNYGVRNTMLTNVGHLAARTSGAHAIARGGFGGSAHASAAA